MKLSCPLFIFLTCMGKRNSACFVFLFWLEVAPFSCLLSVSMFSFWWNYIWSCIFAIFWLFLCLFWLFQGLCWDPQFRIQRLSSKARASSGYCGLRIRASLWRQIICTLIFSLLLFPCLSYCNGLWTRDVVVF